MSFRTFMKTHGKAIVSYVICIIVIITIVLVSVYMNIFSDTTPSAPAPAPTPAPAPAPAPTQTPSTRNMISQEIYSELPSLDEMIKGIKTMNDGLAEFNRNLDNPGSLNLANDLIGKGLDEFMNNPAFQYLMADQNFAEIFSLLIQTANRLDNNNRHKLKALLDQLFRLMIKINNGLVL